MNSLLEVISQKVKPSESEIALCETYFEHLDVPRNTLLEVPEKAPQHLYFIDAGFIRLYYTDADGAEVTSHIGAPRGFITSFLSFIHEKPAREHVQAVTDCSLLRISRPNLVKLIDESESFKQFSLIIFEQAIAISETRANDLATLKAEQRYKKLMETAPLVLQHVPVQYIASYLGMKPESLSRIRRQIIT